MRRLAWTAVSFAAWGDGGVAVAIVLMEVLPPFGATPLFLALLAAGGYAAVKELGPDVVGSGRPGGLVEAAAAREVQCLGVWGLLALVRPLVGHADPFSLARSFGPLPPWRRRLPFPLGPRSVVTRAGVSRHSMGIPS